jgi:tetratricopeptide (TPR) repeat protein/TolB-like protein
MSQCTDQRFRQMLHAYELGMLNDDDRRQVELHLLDCPDCFNYIQSRQDSASLLREDPDVRTAVLEAAKSTGETDRIQAVPAHRMRRIIPAVLVAAAALIILVLRPWNIEIHPTDEVVAAQNRVAVMYFENLADPADSGQLSEVVTNLLITDLSESQYLQVVSSQRLFDIVRLLGEKNITPIDRTTATDIARRAGARWMLLGSILQIEPDYLLTTQLVNVESGTTVASERVAGQPGEAIFEVIDRLTVEVKDDLALPAEAWDEADRHVADVTTHSREAYELYLDGLEALNKYYFDEAREAFSKVVELDSNYAMAYYYLARVDDQSFINRAVAHLDRATDKQKYFIRSLKAFVDRDRDDAIRELEQLLERYPDEKEAYYYLGNYRYSERQFEEAVVSLTKAVELDPFYEPAINLLAYAYAGTGDYKNAINAIDRYIALAPGEPNPYDTRGDIYRFQGKPELAIESYRMAIELKPDFYDSWLKLGQSYLILGEPARADSCLQMVRASGSTRLGTSAYWYTIYIPILSGRFDRALAVLDSAIDVAQRVDTVREYTSYHFLKAVIFEELGEWTAARRESEITVRLASEETNRPPGGICFAYQIYVMAQQDDLVSAQQAADEMLSHLDQDDSGMVYYWLAQGAIEQARGNWDLALARYDQALIDTTLYPAGVLRALTLLDAGRYEEAVLGFEQLLPRSNYWLGYWELWATKVHYYLGQAYETVDRTDDAIKQYSTFLELWKDADTTLGSVAAARQRLAQLQNQP